MSKRLGHKRFPWYKRVKWWLTDTVRATKRQVEAMLWRWRGGGYECIDCGGTDTRFKTGHFEGVVNGGRMLLEYNNYKLPFGKTLCPHCLCSRIKQYWGSATTLLPDDTAGYIMNTSKGVYNGKCTWYGPDLMVAEGIRSTDNPAAIKYLSSGSVIIGGNWWNGHPASLPAITDLLTVSGKLQTSTLINSNMWADDAGHLHITSGQYTDGRISGDPQLVTEIVKGRRQRKLKLL